MFTLLGVNINRLPFFVVPATITKLFAFAWGVETIDKVRDNSITDKVFILGINYN
ncbi:hypothetical protein CAL7716_058850 [Calothrix sp. PCC 7716]|nr:hypothetical protein CAL7716_058850 [Calothrix sp. PCC 7716]